MSRRLFATGAWVSASSTTASIDGQVRATRAAASGVSGTPRAAMFRLTAISGSDVNPRIAGLRLRSVCAILRSILELALRFDSIAFSPLIWDRCDCRRATL
jgi:hypothetical protein